MQAGYGVGPHTAIRPLTLLLTRSTPAAHTDLPVAARLSKTVWLLASLGCTGRPHFPATSCHRREATPPLPHLAEPSHRPSAQIPPEPSVTILIRRHLAPVAAARNFTTLQRWPFQWPTASVLPLREFMNAPPTHTFLSLRASTLLSEPARSSTAGTELTMCQCPAYQCSSSLVLTPSRRTA